MTMLSWSASPARSQLAAILRRDADGLIAITTTDGPDGARLRDQLL